MVWLRREQIGLPSTYKKLLKKGAKEKHFQLDIYVNLIVLVPVESYRVLSSQSYIWYKMEVHRVKVTGYNSQLSSRPCGKLGIHLFQNIAKHRTQGENSHWILQLFINATK